MCQTYRKNILNMAKLRYMWSITIFIKIEIVDFFLFIGLASK